MDECTSKAAVVKELKRFAGYLDDDMLLRLEIAISRLPAVDAVPVVRYRDCKHRIVNEHYGERGYINLKARCELDAGDPYSPLLPIQLGRHADEDDWFCADGERKEELT